MDIIQLKLIINKYNALRDCLTHNQAIGIIIGYTSVNIYIDDILYEYNVKIKIIIRRTMGLLFIIYVIVNGYTEKTKMSAGEDRSNKSYNRK